MFSANHKYYEEMYTLWQAMCKVGSIPEHECVKYKELFLDASIEEKKSRLENVSIIRINDYYQTEKETLYWGLHSFKVYECYLPLSEELLSQLPDDTIIQLINDVKTYRVYTPFLLMLNRFLKQLPGPVDVFEKYFALLNLSESNIRTLQKNPGFSAVLNSLLSLLSSQDEQTLNIALQLIEKANSCSSRLFHCSVVKYNP